MLSGRQTARIFLLSYSCTYDVHWGKCDRLSKISKILLAPSEPQLQFYDLSSVMSFLADYWFWTRYVSDSKWYAKYKPFSRAHDWSRIRHAGCSPTIEGWNRVLCEQSAGCYMEFVMKGRYPGTSWPSRSEMLSLAVEILQHSRVKFCNCETADNDVRLVNL